MFEKNGVCQLCGQEFVRTRPGKKYCSRRCTQSAADRASRDRKKLEILENGTDCPYNKGVVCTDHKCDSCGWNPNVEKQRMARFKYEGVHHEKR